MQKPSFLLSALVAVACVGGGALECSRPARSAAEEHGGELYGRMCAVCHGAAGEGYRADRAPALAHTEFLASASDDFLRSSIRFGRRGTTMSAWALERGGPLSKEDVDAVIAHMKSWLREPRARLDETAVTGDPEKGRAVFERECATCHGAKGTGGPNIQIGSSDLLGNVTDGFLRHAVRYGRAGTPMPGYADKLGDRGVEDIVAFIRSLHRPIRPVATEQAKTPPIPLGPVPLNPKGPEPVGFKVAPATTKVDVVHAQLERKAKMVLLDARAPTDYTAMHLAGAVSVPFYDATSYMDALPKDAWLVCYCACPHAESKSLAQQLQQRGFKKVTVLDEGLGAWYAKKYGVTENSPAP